MKKRLSVLLALLLLTVLVLPAAPVYADEIDPMVRCGFHTNISHNDIPVEGVPIKLYRIAEFDGERIMPTGPYRYYPLDFDIQTALEFSQLAQQVVYYIERDGISPDDYGTSDIMGDVMIYDLDQGLYLALYGDNGTYTYYDYETDDMVRITFDPILVSLPTMDDGENWNYNVSVAPKYIDDVTPTPSEGGSKKKVNDINDTTLQQTIRKDSADHDLGDSFTYTITAFLPSNYAEFSAAGNPFYLQFFDDVCEGITINTESWRAYYGPKTTDDDYYPTGTEITSLFRHMAAGAPVKDYYTTRHTWTCEDLTQVPGITADSMIWIEYEAHLNEKAVIGSQGNPNEMYIVYSNDPGSNATAKTEPDKNIVFTYKAVFEKVDNFDNPLTGAEFKLEKKVSGDWVDVTTLGGSGGVHPYLKIEGNRYEFIGIDDGEYRFTEVKAPSGYNKRDPFTFTITATHDLIRDDPQLRTLTVASTDVTMSKYLQSGTVKGKIVNTRGIVLPNTGADGTRTLILAGSALLLVGGIVLVVRRRSHA